LQELLQGKKVAVPEYAVVHTGGEAHAQVFIVECFIQKMNIRTVGEGTSRRIAEQKAAQLALLELEKIRFVKSRTA
jgi:ribonuclease-3